MTHEEWVKLTPEQQRIKVAELCGWKKTDRVQPVTCLPLWEHPTRHWYFTDGTIGSKVCKTAENLPDYLNDLNAMHEAEEYLDPRTDLPGRYYQELIGVVYDWDYLHGIDGLQVARAPAAKRAEAFVLTMMEGNR